MLALASSWPLNQPSPRRSPISGGAELLEDALEGVLARAAVLHALDDYLDLLLDGLGVRVGHASTELASRRLHAPCTLQPRLLARLVLARDQAHARRQALHAQEGGTEDVLREVHGALGARVRDARGLLDAGLQAVVVQAHAVHEALGVALAGHARDRGHSRARRALHGVHGAREEGLQALPVGVAAGAIPRRFREDRWQHEPVQSGAGLLQDGGNRRDRLLLLSLRALQADAHCGPCERQQQDRGALGRHGWSMGWFGWAT
mmetsp:Transcript_45684/g.141226  ORF Transcript_45684/g.141226 Transcript_45684/m.141226 type:complete len:262 (+) Transcript_45684:58-843(+)